MLARHIKRIQAIIRADSLVAMSFEQIGKELHIELIVLDYENLFGHDLKHDAAAFPSLGHVIARPVSPRPY
ncbi:MAG: hypothetical protein DHS20C06_10090 [Hyphobacterium sp.]|nr:MAG: hypothetical protein DHS20C06_10090 [Hyphobacterium sp.]